MNFDLADYKKIAKKYNLQVSDEELAEIVKNIKELADVFVKFVKRKKIIR